MHDGTVSNRDAAISLEEFPLHDIAFCRCGRDCGADSRRENDADLHDSDGGVVFTMHHAPVAMAQS